MSGEFFNRIFQILPENWYLPWHFTSQYWILVVAVENWKRSNNIFIFSWYLNANKSSVSFKPYWKTNGRNALHCRSEVTQAAMLRLHDQAQFVGDTIWTKKIIQNISKIFLTCRPCSACWGWCAAGAGPACGSRACTSARSSRPSGCRWAPSARTCQGWCYYVVMLLCCYVGDTRLHTKVLRISISIHSRLMKQRREHPVSEWTSN